MSLKDWLNPETREQTKVERRVAKIGTSDLLGWAEIAADGIARELSDWRRSEDAFHLNEASTNAEVLLAAIHEIQRRTQPS